MMVKYTVLIEKGEQSYGAYVPDLPGCISVGDTLDEVRQMIREAMEFHIEGLLRDGDPVPEPTTQSLEVEIDMARIAALAKEEEAKHCDPASELRDAIFYEMEELEEHE